MTKPNKIKLSKADRVLLWELKKLDFAKIEMKALKVHLMSVLPREYDPANIDRRLVRETRLTLAGLRLIDPKNRYLNTVELATSAIRSMIISNPKIECVEAESLATAISIKSREAQIALLLLNDLNGFFGGASSFTKEVFFGFTSASFPINDNAYDRFLSFNCLSDEIDSFISQQTPQTEIVEMAKQYNAQAEVDELATLFQNPWALIETEFSISKRTFGKRINFVKDKHKRTAIFRDVAHSFILQKLRAPKPAVILAGSVVEELLRLLLVSKGFKPSGRTFDSYIKDCEKHKLLKAATISLFDSVRHFRNHVHLQSEQEPSDALKSATARSAIASVFVLVEALR